MRSRLNPLIVALLSCTLLLNYCGSNSTSTSNPSPTPTPTPSPTATAPDITTFHDNNSRDGLNAQETTLTLSNVNSTQFGKVGFDSVDGLVDAEPLFLAGVNTGGSMQTSSTSPPNTTASTHSTPIPALKSGRPPSSAPARPPVTRAVAVRSALKLESPQHP